MQVSAGLVDAMTDAARAWLVTLDAAQTAAATHAFTATERTDWTYLPGPRPGLPLVDMTAAQRSLAFALLDTGCSAIGARTARAVIELEAIRRTLATGAEIDGDRYWFQVFGEPGGAEPWAWHVNGHHLAVHVTVAGTSIGVTPSFLGAEPATVGSGPSRGLRVLAMEEDLGRALLADLTREQRSTAIVDDVAPRDILTTTEPRVDPAAVPRGLSHAEMSASSRVLLVRLVSRYLERAPVEYAQLTWQVAADEGLDGLHFAWAGSDRPGQGHYYCVTAPTFVLEYDNTQDDANHIHSVWRDLRNDWGEDALARHYAEHHSG